MKNQTHSFRTKLWLYFVLFAAVIFSLLWILQTVGLQRFYDGMMEQNIRNAARTIVSSRGSDNFFNVIDQLSVEDSLLVYVTDENGNIYYSSDSYKPYFRQMERPGFDKPDRNFFRRRTDPADFQGGSLRDLPDNYTEFLEKLSASETGTVEYTSRNTYVYGTHVRFGDDDDDDDDSRIGVLYVAGTLSAVGAAASIIRTQLLWVTGLSLIFGFVIAWIISRRFAKPINQLTEQAKMLSEEHYEDRFQKGFCRELDDLDDSLTQSAEKLSEAREYQKELLANVSHDLRTPLTMIRGYAEMVRDISWEDEAQRNADTGVIIKEADRMTALVNEILEYSRLNEKSFEISFKEIDLSALTEDVAARFEPLFRKEGGIIERKISPNCLVRGDRELLERAVFNLIENAVHHSAGPDKRIIITVREQESHIYLEVRDHGEGIAPEELPRIWEKYYTSRQRGSKGVSGLGLAIVKQTAVLHHAEVRAESVQGEGSAFSMIF